MRVHGLPLGQRTRRGAAKSKGKYKTAIGCAAKLGPKLQGRVVGVIVGLSIRRVLYTSQTLVTDGEYHDHQHKTSTQRGRLLLGFEQ